MSMARMTSNARNPRIKYGYSSQLTNWILDSGATCHMTQKISVCIPGSLVETDKCNGVADGKFFTAKETVEVQIEMRDDN